MSRVRRIEKKPSGTNYFLVDACFLANRYIPTDNLSNHERDRVEKCQKWWQEINAQQERKKAIVYIPDICIAEAFKVLARKYYRDRVFSTPAAYGAAKRKLSQDITISVETLKKSNRPIKYHDISTSRDIIISVDRFLEVFMKKRLKISVPDLIVLAVAKYLIDFFRIPRSNLFIVTTDNNLHKGSRCFPYIPRAHDPTKANERAEKVFK
jgi:hypothetical protein